MIVAGQWIGVGRQFWLHLWCAKRLVAKALREADLTERREALTALYRDLRRRSVCVARPALSRGHVVAAIWTAILDSRAGFEWAEVTQTRSKGRGEVVEAAVGADAVKVEAGDMQPGWP